MAPEVIDGFPAVRLAAGDLEAGWVPGAGMVGASLRHRGEELLGLRDGLRAYVERGKTMGIPLLHPWANRLSGDDYEFQGARVTLPAQAPGLRREDHGLPIHGLLAASPDWRVISREPSAVTATLDFAARPQRLDLFPFPHTITVAVELDVATLKVDTRIEATGDVAVPIGFGWHPYLRLPGVARPEWVLELPVRRHLLTDRLGIPTGEVEPTAARSGPLAEDVFDDGYDELGEPVMVLSGGGRRLAVRLLAGYPVTQVFAPPGQDLVALEPMTAPTDALRSGRGRRSVAPGETFSASFAVEVTGSDR